MKVKMLQNQIGSPDGIKIVQYKKDQIYELEGSLLDAFVKQMKIAEPVPDENVGIKMEKEPQNKKVEKRENKSIKRDNDF